MQWRQAAAGRAHGKTLHDITGHRVLAALYFISLGNLEGVTSLHADVTLPRSSRQ